MTPGPRCTHRLILLGCACFWAVCLPGCSRSTYPVIGQIVMSDGSSPKELQGYQIAFEGQQAPVSAVGTIKADGSFELDTLQSGDGAKPGKYKVTIQPPQSTNPEEGQSKPAPAPKSILHERYRHLRTTNLEVEIEAKPNHVKLTVDRAPRKK